MPSRDRAAFLLRDQGRYCADMGSPLYAYLLERAAEDAESGDPVYDVLEPDSPLAWVRLEPTPATRGYAVTLTTWPGGEGRVVATSGAHGSEVRRGGAARE